MAEPIRYPDPAFKILDPRFAPLVLGNTPVQRIAGDCLFTEGPVWFGDGRYLLWSDIPNDRIMRWEEETGAVSTFRRPSGYANGNTRDRQGRLVTCEMDSQQLTRTEYDGSVTVLAHSFDGKRLTAPNDVVVKSDGSIWFSDNGAGTRGNYLGHTAPQELPFRVYRIDPVSGEMTIAVGDMQRPNGLAFSPDEKRLYVVDTPGGDKTVHVYDVGGDGKTLGNGRVFFNEMPGYADGIRCDTQGNVWSGFSGGEGQDGVAIHAPDGKLIGRILLPERCANVCFGGRKRNRLFMAASQSVYACYVEAQGAVGGLSIFQEAVMRGEAAGFVGNIPEHYDRGLGPVLFADFADDLARRVAAPAPLRVLETAAGTGILTRRLRDLLPAGAQLTATDLNPPMLEAAKLKFAAGERVAFQQADATALPFGDGSFDAVVCQFGVMFFPDKDKAYREVRRVLAPGGSFVFSVWDSHRYNRFARIVHEILATYFPADPPRFYEVPFHYHSIDAIRDALAQAGLTDLRAAVLSPTRDVADLHAFAAALIYGNPVIDQIAARGGADAAAIVDAVEAALRAEFGSGPSRIPLQTIAFEAKRG